MADTNTRFTPIRAISTYINKFTLKVRVVSKTEKKMFQKKDNEMSGRFFSVELLDSNRDLIRATAFQGIACLAYCRLGVMRICI